MGKNKQKERHGTNRGCEKKNLKGLPTATYKIEVKNKGTTRGRTTRGTLLRNVSAGVNNL